MHLYRNRRGALEGLPLYLIILVVVAAVVIVILLGWLSTLNKPSLGTTTYYVDSYQNGMIDSNTANITQVGQECFVQVKAPGGVALKVDTFDTHSNTLSGVNIKLQPNSGILSLNASPGIQLTSGSNGAPAGEVTFNSLTFYMQPGAPSGDISILFSYSGGIAQGQSSQDISVDTTSSGLSC